LRQSRLRLFVTSRLATKSTGDKVDRAFDFVAGTVDFVAGAVDKIDRAGDFVDRRLCRQSSRRNRPYVGVSLQKHKIMYINQFTDTDTDSFIRNRKAKANTI